MAGTHYCFGAYLQRRSFRGCRAKRPYAHSLSWNPPLDRQLTAAPPQCKPAPPYFGSFFSLNPVCSAIRPSPPRTNDILATYLETGSTRGHRTHSRASFFATGGWCLLRQVKSGVTSRCTCKNRNRPQGEAQRSQRGSMACEWARVSRQQFQRLVSCRLSNRGRLHFPLHSPSPLGRLFSLKPK